MITATIFEAKTKLSELVRQVQKGETVVSAACAWEMATKVRVGKWPEAVAVERELLMIVRDAGYELLPIYVQTALRAGRLLGEHRDPFDRIIAAQAFDEDIAVVSADAKLDEFGIRRIW